LSRREHRTTTRRGTLRVGVTASVVVLGVIAAGCLPVVPPPPPSVLAISASPALFPSFSPSVTDYVSRCSASGPVTVSVAAPPGTTVSVDGQSPASGSFAADVTRDVGQSFTIVVQEPSQPPSTHYVRCLPADFPSWTTQTSGATQAQYYVTVPIVASGKNYPAIFDSNGVPVWWGATANAAFATLLPDGNIAWTNVNGAEEHALDGSLVRSIKPTVGSTDIHELLVLPNGDYVIGTDTVRSGIDLSRLCVGATCGPVSASVLDPVIQELKPDGTLVWSWDAADHIPASEMDPQWYQQYIVGGSGPYDVYHWNSAEFTGSGFIFSFRHEDAVYDVDQSTGNVLWKLGGSSRPGSLVVNGDPVFPTSGFGGQHDARLLSDGTVTLYDDGTGRNRAPRAVRYQIDTTTTPGTATLVEQLGDPLISSSFCCGAARKLSGGDWVMGWGGTDTDTEMTSTGTRVFLLQFGDGALIYRSVPVPYGQLDPAALRAGMDSQYSSSGSAHSTTQAQSGTTTPRF